MAENTTPHMPIHESNLPEAKHLAELFSVMNDIQLVVDCLNWLIAEGLKPDSEKNGLFLQAFFSTALITYRRAFASGVRVNGGLMNKDAEGLPNNTDGFHVYLIGQADKLIAHSVNPFEQVKAGIMLQNRKVVGSGRINIKLVNMDDDRLRKWGRLTVEVHENVLKPRIQAAEKALYEAALNLPIEEIMKMPLLEASPFHTDDDAQKRRN